MASSYKRKNHEFNKRLCMIADSNLPDLANVMRVTIYQPVKVRWYTDLLRKISKALRSSD